MFKEIIIRPLPEQGEGEDGLVVCEREEYVVIRTDAWESVFVRKSDVEVLIAVLKAIK